MPFKLDVTNNIADVSFANYHKNNCTFSDSIRNLDKKITFIGLIRCVDI